MEHDVLEKRKENALNFLKNKKTLFIILAIIFIASLSFYIRTRNVALLDGHLADPDAHAFLRYSRSVVETGSLPEIDTMRYVPLGFHPRSEFSFLSYFIAYMYEFFRIFNSSITLEQIDIIYPAIASILGVFFFFLLARKLFDYRVALLATLFLNVIPGYLFRTLSGVSDKEAIAMPLLYLSFYLFISAIQAKRLRNALIISTLAGITTGITALAWGGVVYILVAIGGYALLELLLLKFSKRDFYIYSLWAILTFGVMMTIGSERYSINILASSLTTALILFSFLFAIINFFIYHKNILKIKDKLEKINFPLSLNILFVTLFITFLITSAMYGPLFLFKVIYGNIGEVVNPQQTDRWSLTVAENHAVFIQDWFNDFGQILVWLLIIASIWLFYDMVKIIKNYRWKLTFVYTLFILGFIFSRYSSSSILNGTSILSYISLYGSIILIISYFAYVYFYTFFKDKESFSQISNMDKKYTIIFIWFLLGILGAKFLARLIFPFSPLVCLLFGFLVFSAVDFLKNTTSIKNKNTKVVTYVILGLMVFYLFFGFLRITLATAASVGPMYNIEWQQAENWVKANTPENSVFIHWWDYGYLVQTGFNRPTVTDGGNTIGPWNYFTARYLLTAPPSDNQQTMSFLKTHNVSYLLIVGDDIGKYPAYSSIGSDQNYDRYSWIGTYSLDLQKTQEKTNTTEYFYAGGTPLDQDIIYNGKLYSKDQSIVYGFVMPVTKGNNSRILQPTMLLYDGTPTLVPLPLECIFIDNKELNFENNLSIKGCLRIIPFAKSSSISGQQPTVNPIGAALYLSPKVRNTLFTHLYLYGEETKNFKLAYSDENTGMPLLVYDGRLIAPMKIWNVTYDPGTKINQTYLETTYNDPTVTYVTQ